VRKLNSISARELVRESVPSLVAAVTMAAVMVPVQFLLVEAQTHGTIVGLLLVVAEGIAGLAVYALTMLVIGRSTIREMRDLAFRMLPARRAH
jgi:hypothetical protein